jgi:hypothetical protein
MKQARSATLKINILPMFFQVWNDIAKLVSRFFLKSEKSRVIKTEINFATFRFRRRVTKLRPSNVYY